MGQYKSSIGLILLLLCTIIASAIMHSTAPDTPVAVLVIYDPPPTYEPIAEAPYEPTVFFALCPTQGIHFYPSYNKIYIPYTITIQDIAHNPAFYIHDITLADAYLPRENTLFLLYSNLIINIAQQDNTLSIRTRYPAKVTHNGGYLQVTNLRDIYHTIILIDPGHGGLDTGAPNALGRHYPSESAIVLDISNLLLEIFDHPGILLVPTRTTDEFVDNTQRYRLANRLADYFISIHGNACAVSRQTAGTLTLYGQAPGSHDLAYALQEAIAYALQSRNRGIQYAPEFRILYGSNVPVVMLELLFMSNPNEVTRLMDQATQLKIATAIAEVIKTLL